VADVVGVRLTIGVAAAILLAGVFVIFQRNAELRGIE
jgi:hypothetical protein